MALLDFLKNKKEADKAKAQAEAKASLNKKKPAAKKSEKPVAKKEVAKEVEVVKEPAIAKGSGLPQSFSYSVIKEPHISEKATDLGYQNKYTFKVYENANKPEIKKSVEGIYKVNVLNVNIIKAPKKKRRLGKTQGYKKAFTKAVVTIKEGQKIEIL